jgi:3-phosphoshikimate 1-carboxyvinyltransferase
MTDSPSRSTEAPPPLRRLDDGAVLVPAGLRAAGRLAPPSSKSLTHRAFDLALLAGAPLRVERPLDAEDTRLFRAALGVLGFTVTEEQGGAGALAAVVLEPGPRPEAAELFCGNAGTLYRFLVAALAALPGRWRLDGVGRLRERPVGPLVDALRPLGAEIESDGADGYAPMTIHGRRLAGGRTTLDAGASSQYLSAILMAALVAADDVEVTVGALTSAPYVDLTLDMVERFGGRVEADGGVYRVQPGLVAPGRLRIEADLSAACYPAAAAALTGGRVVLAGVAAGSRQGDRRFFELLAEMGAEVEWRTGDEGEEVEVRGTGVLRALDADLSALPDQVPTLAALAPFARGTTRIRNVPHLRIKESDRLAAMAHELGRIGAPVEELEDGLVIPGIWADDRPTAPAAPFRIDPHGDHRIAMSLAVAGLARPGVAVAHPGVVGKSYPRFWTDLASLLSDEP